MALRSNGEPGSRPLARPARFRRTGSLARALRQRLAGGMRAAPALLRFARGSGAGLDRERGGPGVDAPYPLVSASAVMSAAAAVGQQPRTSPIRLKARWSRPRLSQDEAPTRNGPSHRHFSDLQLGLLDTNGVMRARACAVLLRASSLGARGDSTIKGPCMTSAADYDVVVAGASIAGCTVATLLGRAGRGLPLSSSGRTPPRTRRSARTSSSPVRLRRSSGSDWQSGSKRRAGCAPRLSCGRGTGGSDRLRSSATATRATDMTSVARSSTR
jgi:hypothetical protein